MDFCAYDVCYSSVQVFKGISFAGIALLAAFAVNEWMNDDDDLV